MPGKKHTGKNKGPRKTTSTRQKARIKPRGNEKRKYEVGAATSYISRTQALKKLQLSLKDFRRMCILKGIYPHEPRHKKQANKGSTEQKTWYYLKDVLFLAHEPVVAKFREQKIFLKRVTKAKAKHEREQLEYLEDNRPIYRLDHIVRERYPYFCDALRDLDDALCLCSVFARLPQSAGVSVDTIYLCRRLTVEFMHYVIESRALRKKEEGSDSVDWNVMGTFVEFYTSLLAFVNYKLYTTLGLHYPPKLEHEPTKDDETMAAFYRDVQLPKERVFNLALPLLRTADKQGAAGQDGDEMHEDPEVDGLALEGDVNEEREKQRQQMEGLKRLRSLFKDCRFFLGREVPRESMALVIRSCGGEVSWDESVAYGAPYAETDAKITHQIVDRPNFHKNNKLNIARTYVQPQWVYDSVNARRRLPPGTYAPDAALPAHLSPFVVDETPGDYVPEGRLDALAADGHGTRRVCQDIHTAAVGVRQRERASTLAARDVRARRRAAGASVAVRRR